MDPRMSKVIWRAEKALHWRTRPRDARPHQTISNWMWCFQICNRCGLNSVGFEWRPTPLRVYFQNILPDRVKLRDLWQRIDGNHPSPRRMVTLHPRLPPYDNNTFRSQKSDVLPTCMEIKSKTSKMVAILIWVRHQIGAHGRNKNDPIG